VKESQDADRRRGRAEIGYKKVAFFYRETGRIASKKV
jgi:hypothetical protein